MNKMLQLWMTMFELFTKQVGFCNPLPDEKILDWSKL